MTELRIVNHTIQICLIQIQQVENTKPGSQRDLCACTGRAAYSSFSWQPFLLPAILLWRGTFLLPDGETKIFLWYSKWNEMLPGLYSSGEINSLVHVDDRGGRRRYYSILSFVELLFYYNLHFEKKFKVLALCRHLITRVGTFFCPIHSCNTVIQIKISAC